MAIQNSKKTIILDVDVVEGDDELGEVESQENIDKSSGDKSSFSGCYGFIVLVIFIMFLLIRISSCQRSDNSSSYDDKWFSGGTLNGRLVGDWRKASTRNKLATCANWLANTCYKEAKMNAREESDDLRRDSELLISEIDDRIESVEYPDDYPITYVAVGIITFKFKCE